jgi:ssRNA-specific RNase YbeY (16S rRNA maturation enzyme)
MARKQSRSARGTAGSTEEPLVCQPKYLPRKKLMEAARRAAAINPVNQPAAALVGRAQSLKPEFISVLTTKYWGPAGVNLSVSFMDGPPKALRDRILAHLNAWSKKANVTFRFTANQGQVRIARLPGDGYWSYVGTDVLSIPLNEPTMNLDSFTMNTPESEYKRVVRHEAGHTLGYPHEHMRRQLVALIDKQKAIAHFGATQGWDPEMVQLQVLTPLEDGSLISTEHADPKSIMCYHIPGFLTKNGQPILGGTDIVAADHEFTGRIYPKPKKKTSAAAGRKRTASARKRPAAPRKRR